MATGMPAQEHETLVTRFVDVEPNVAFEAWAKTEHLNSWFTSNAQQDFRVGGTFSNGDGDTGEFLQIVLDHLINFTWSSKHHEPGSDVVVTITDEDKGCFVSLLHRNLSSQKDAEDLQEAWSWALDSLKSYLETGKAISLEHWKASATPQ